MAGLFPLSRMQQFDSNGELLVGNSAISFRWGGRLRLRVGYRDSSLTSPHRNPIVADAARQAPANVSWTTDFIGSA